MAEDYYLTMKGIKGESKNVTDAMEIKTWTWSATQKGSAASGGGLTTGRTTMEDFEFTIVNGKSSTDLMLYCVTGKPITDAKLQCRKSGGDPKDYLVVEFKDLIISSFATTGNGGDDSIPIETVKFNFSMIKVAYFEQQKDGSMVSAGKMKFDLKSGKGE